VSDNGAHPEQNLKLIGSGGIYKAVVNPLTRSPRIQISITNFYSLKKSV